MKRDEEFAARHKWSSSFAFFAAAIGSAIGISNIWKFTYVAGANGGGAFVLVYVLALLGIALPALIAEFLIGRQGGHSAVGTLQALTRHHGIHPAWKLYPVLAIVGVFLALSFYSVIAGWTVDYFVLGLGNAFADLDAAGSSALFGEMIASPVRMSGYQLVFVGLTAAIVALGVRRGVERFLQWMTPGLFVILTALIVYAAATTDFAAGVAFLFAPDFSKITTEVVLMAVGQAFFSLGVGLGVLMTIGAYMERDLSIVKSGAIIALADGGVALLAGLAIFPIVLHYGLSPAQGPGLIFETLPIAFSEMPLGAIFGPAFFILLTLAALTSTITILEAIVACFEDYTSLSRPAISWLLALGLVVVGLGTVFSFNIWADWRPLSFIPAFSERNFFGILDYAVSNVLMPLGGIAVALIAGWALSRETTLAELGLHDGMIFGLWRFAVRFVVPAAIALVFWLNI